VLTHEGGLHARPSILLSQLATRFSARVWIGLAADGPWIDAKSIARVMALKTVGQTMMFFFCGRHRCWRCGKRLGQVGGKRFYEFQWSIEINDEYQRDCLFTGISASPGLARGPLRFLDEIERSGRR